jgi:hypothetical protein
MKHRRTWRITRHKANARFGSKARITAKQQQRPVYLNERTYALLDHLTVSDAHPRQGTHKGEGSAATPRRHVRACHGMARRPSHTTMALEAMPAKPMLNMPMMMPGNEWFT